MPVYSGVKNYKFKNNYLLYYIGLYSVIKLAMQLCNKKRIKDKPNVMFLEVLKNKFVFFSTSTNYIYYIVYLKLKKYREYIIVMSFIKFLILLKYYLFNEI